MKRTLSELRNIGIMAHVDAGKTTLTERLLKLAGRIHRIGEVHDGNTTMDFDPDERARGITINSAATRFEWRDTAVNLIDTPGHVDFTIEVERALRVLDGAVAVFCAVGGVEPQSETVWRQADRYRVPRLAFVNKMDRLGADFARVLAEIRQHLDVRPVVLAAPIGAEDEFVGVLDVLGRRALVWSGEGLEEYEVRGLTGEQEEEVERWREELVEAVCDVDEDSLTAWADGSLDDERLWRGLRRATLSGALVPTLSGSAYRSRGIQPLLDAIVDLLPSPLDVPPVEGVRDEEETTLAPEADAPLAALAFKVVEDRFGRLTYVRIYSGTLRRGESVVDTATGRKARVSRILRVHADQKEELELASAGDIVALVGPKDVATGHTLTAPGDDLLLEGLEVPEPVVRLAIEPATAADQGKLSVALARLRAEDPSLAVLSDPETGQTLLAGMGELHLEVVAGRLQRDHGVEVAVGRPQVAYREAVTRSSAARGRLKKQTGGPGQFAVVELELEPAARDQEVAFEARVDLARVPREYHRAVEAGVRDSLEAGPLAGYPVVGLRVALVGGAWHRQDSSDLAFREAARLAMREALARAGVVLLEPVMDVEVTAPEAATGDLIGDLGARRGVVRGLDPRGSRTVLRARAPLAELFGYAGQVRGLSEGRGTFSMQFAAFEEVPGEVQAEVLRTLQGA